MVETTVAGGALAFEVALAPPADGVAAVVAVAVAAAAAAVAAAAFAAAFCC